MIRAKYLKKKTLMLCREGCGSQFWRGISKVKHKFNWGPTYSVKSGREVRFWEDVWILRLTSLDYRQGVTAVGAALAGGLAALPRRYGAVVDAAQCCHVGMVRWWRTF